MYIVEAFAHEKDSFKMRHKYMYACVRTYTHKLEAVPVTVMGTAFLQHTFGESTRGVPEVELQSLRITQMVPGSWKGSQTGWMRSMAPRSARVFALHGQHPCITCTQGIVELTASALTCIQILRKYSSTNFLHCRTGGKRATWSHSHALHAQRGGVVPSPVQHTYASGAL